jgi:hypothetical protein
MATVGADHDARADRLAPAKDHTADSILLPQQITHDRPRRELDVRRPASTLNQDVIERLTPNRQAVPHFPRILRRTVDRLTTALQVRPLMGQRRASKLKDLRQHIQAIEDADHSRSAEEMR